MRTKTIEIIKFGRKLYQKGLIAGFDGNLSCKICSNKILITASNVHKGFLTSDNIINIDIKGKVLNGKMEPSSETPMHLEIYKKTKAKAIIHAHAPFTIAASIALKEIDLSGIIEGRLFFKNIIVVPELEPGTMQLAKSAGEAAEKSKIFILKAHGVVAWGKNLLEAFGLIEALEHNIKIMAYKKLLTRL